MFEVIKDFIYFPDNSDKDFEDNVHLSIVLLRQINCMRISRLIFALKEMARWYILRSNRVRQELYNAFSYPYADEKQTLSSSSYSSLFTDRTDLDDQLSKQFVGSKKYNGDETVVNVSPVRNFVRSFKTREWRCLSDYHSEIYRGFAASYRQKTNVICISDEAH